jgi:D-beta-D-heptose 7-phosphate kinase/D-beta-D-heptose 1-phosphate adenosyltransferase
VPPVSEAERLLARHLAAFPAQTLLVLGDVMLDRYVHGEVRRISPEAPIPVLRARARRSVLGGAGNVAENAVALGARAILVGLVGDDAVADEIAASLEGRIGDGLVRVAGRASTVKTRFMSGSHQLLRLDDEDTDPAPAEAEARLLAAFHAALPGADMVVLSDYEKGALTDAVLHAAIAAARAAGTPVVVDPKRAGFAAYAGASVITPNTLEVSRATGLPADDDAAAARAGEAALAQAGAEAVLVKRSEKGLTLVRHGQPPRHVPTRAVAVADVSGAGDTLVTTFALALAAGAAMEEAAQLANVAAGLAVAKPGTATVSRDELAAALHREEVLAIDGKVMALDAALSRIAAWRARGERVGFTNGCFDLIHPGHVRLLAAARAQCDRLVVALNSDASVQRLKGPDRPVQTEAARATVMASMAACDLVVLFEEDTPERLIRAILPDVLIKGADYTIEQVVGADVVQAAGGRVALIPIEAGHSTTGTIRRINLSG